MAPMAQMPRPRRPVIKLPVYILSQSASGLRGSSPISISSRPKTQRVGAFGVNHRLRDPWIGVHFANACDSLIGVNQNNKVVLSGGTSFMS